MALVKFISVTSNSSPWEILGSISKDSAISTSFNCLNCLMPVFVLLLQSSLLSILDYSVIF